MTKSVLFSLLIWGLLPATSAASDLSSYRDFQLGSNLATVSKKAGLSPSLAKTVYRRPSFIQELAWRPRPLGQSAKSEPVEQVVFSFQDGVLFQIGVHYDRYETEGLTADDFIEAISATYGTAVKPTASHSAIPAPYGDQEEVLARWEDPQYRLELIRESYGPAFKLTATLKSVEKQALSDSLEAKRLDDQEAPQRDAARIANEEEMAKAKMEKARQANKLKFRP